MPLDDSPSVHVTIASAKGDTIVCRDCNTLHLFSDGKGKDVATKQGNRRLQARAIELAMIKNHPEYSNKINGISTKRDWYNDAVTWGEAWLREHRLLE